MKLLSNAIFLASAVALVACSKKAEEDPVAKKSDANSAAKPVATQGEIPGPASVIAGSGLVATPAATPEEWRSLLAAAKKADELGNVEQAESLHREALADTERRGLVGPPRDQALNDLAYFLYFKGRLDEAIVVFEQMTRERDAALLGDLHKLGNAYAFAGNRDRAEAVFSRAVEIARRIEHPSTAQVVADHEAMKKKFAAPPPPAAPTPAETAPPEAAASAPAASEPAVATITTGEPAPAAGPPAPEVAPEAASEPAPEAVAEPIAPAEAAPPAEQEAP